MHTLGSVIEVGENGIKDVELLHVQNIVVECPSLGEGRYRDRTKIHTEARVVLNEQGASLKPSGGIVRCGRGSRLNSLSSWAVQRPAESLDNRSHPS